MPYIHNFSPDAISIGSIHIKWYGISYVLALIFTWLGLRRYVKRDYPQIPMEKLDDLSSWLVAGLLLGGRLGYALFYEPSMFLTPIELLKVWQGGMSFHGAVLGIALCGIYACKRIGYSVRYIADKLGIFAPLGIFLGRLANFINSEHYGYPTDVPWAVVFPMVDQQPRHPSQLYEALLEGMVLGALMAILHYFYKLDEKRKGSLFGAFLMGYAVTRWVCEYFRVPDGYFMNLTYGQFLGLPLFIIGLMLIIRTPSRFKVARS